MKIVDVLPEGLKCSPDIQELIEKKVNAFASLSDDLPVYIIHELTSGSYTVVYMSPKGLASIGTDLNAVRSMGVKYYESFFNTEDAKNYLASWSAFIAEPSNRGTWFSFFQQVKTQASEIPLWFLSVSTVIAYDEKETPLFSITLALKIHQYMPIAAKLDRLVGENQFLKNNINRFASLTKKEKEMLQLIAKGVSPKNIADQLCTSENTVRTHRRNIKKKLLIKNEVDFVYYAQAFNLV